MKACRLLLAALLVSGAVVGCAPVGEPSSINAGARVTAPAPEYDLTRPETLPKQLEVPLAQRGPYLLGPTRLNGQNAGLFLVDTGSALDAVEIGLANRLDLPLGNEGTAIGIGGRQRYRARRVRRWQFNGVGMPRRTLAALRLRELNQAAPFHANGVIGYRALSEVPFTLDPAHAKLYFYNPRTFEPPADARRVDLHRHAYLPAVHATLGNGQPIRLVLDSGADNAITLPRSVLKRWPEIAAVPRTGGGQSRGIGGTIQSTRTWLKTLNVFGLSLHNLPVAFETATPGMQRGDRPVGRIGLALLKHCQLTFDPAREALWIKWRPRLNDESPAPAQPQHQQPSQ